MKEIPVGGAACEVDVNDAAAVGGGVEDAYGEDRATEDQPVTPWAVCVARYVRLLFCSSCQVSSDSTVTDKIIRRPRLKLRHSFLRSIIYPFQHVIRKSLSNLTT